MKSFILKLLSACFQAIDTLLCELHIKRPTVIVYMDGGICSQIYIWVKGQYYAENGLDVRYDLHWFETCGKDQFGNMPRVFELLEMWPNLPFKTVSKLMRKIYLLFFQADTNNGNWLPTPSSLKHSIYFYGYWNMPSELYEGIFHKFFNISWSAVPAKVDRSCYLNCVGIHVRRGDLAKGDNPAYGGVSEGYFQRAIEFCNNNFCLQKFLFFSDEPDWVEQNICSEMKQPYEIIRNNKAWEDLWLLAHCPVVVSSQGSFGKMAAGLNDSIILLQCDNSHADRERKNSFLIQ